MKCIIYKYASWLLALFLLTACSEDLVPKMSELIVSEKELVLQGSGDEMATLQVKTNSVDWSFACGESWLKIVRSGSNLQCRAEDNNTGVSRYAKIILTSGQLIEEVIVEQLASHNSISADINELRVTQWGGTFTVNVNVAHDNWEPIVSEEWLHATPNTIKGSVVLTVAATSQREERSASLTIRDKQTGNAFDIKVTQDAIVYMLVPYFPFNDAHKAVEDFELSRRSVILERPASSVISGGNTEYLLKVRTISPLFYRIEYLFRKGKMVEATMYAPFATLNEELFVLSWLMANGYEDQGGSRFFNANNRATVVKGVLRTGAEWYLRFSYTPLQPQPQETFAEFPWGIVAEDDYQLYGREQIHDWETNKGSTTNSSENIQDVANGLEALTYHLSSTSQYPFIKTRYTFSTKPEDNHAPLKVVLHSFPAVEEVSKKVVWIYEGKPLLTEEFSALAKRNGFVYQGLTSDGRHVLFNDSRKIHMGVGYVTTGTSIPYVTIEYHYFNP